MGWRLPWLPKWQPSVATYRRYRWLVLGFACLQAFLASGIMYGWAALYSVWLQAGVYNGVCEDHDDPSTAAASATGSFSGHGDNSVDSNASYSGDNDDAESAVVICDAQKVRLQHIFTIAASVNLVAQLVWGFVLDNMGPRGCCVLSGLVVCLGMSLLAASGPGFDGYLIGFALVGGAGPGIQISLFHISQLFPSHKSTVLSLITGCFQLGFAVFFGFRWAAGAWGIGFAQLAAAYTCVLAVATLLGLVVWPDHPIHTYEAFPELFEAVDEEELVKALLTHEDSDIGEEDTTDHAMGLSPEHPLMMKDRRRSYPVPTKAKPVPSYSSFGQLDRSSHRLTPVPAPSGMAAPSPTTTTSTSTTGSKGGVAEYSGDLQRLISDQGDPDAEDALAAAMAARAAAARLMPPISARRKPFSYEAASPMISPQQAAATPETSPGGGPQGQLGRRAGVLPLGEGPTLTLVSQSHLLWEAAEEAREYSPDRHALLGHPGGVPPVFPMPPPAGVSSSSITAAAATDVPDRPGISLDDMELGLGVPSHLRGGPGAAQHPAVAAALLGSRRRRSSLSTPRTEEAKRARARARRRRSSMSVTTAEARLEALRQLRRQVAMTLIFPPASEAALASSARAAGIEGGGVTAPADPRPRRLSAVGLQLLGGDIRKVDSFHSFFPLSSSPPRVLRLRRGSALRWEFPDAFAAAGVALEAATGLGDRRTRSPAAAAATSASMVTKPTSPAHPRGGAAVSSYGATAVSVVAAEPPETGEAIAQEPRKQASPRPRSSAAKPTAAAKKKTSRTKSPKDSRDGHSLASLKAPLDSQIGGGPRIPSPPSSGSSSTRRFDFISKPPGAGTALRSPRRRPSESGSTGGAGPPSSKSPASTKSPSALSAQSKATTTKSEATTSVRSSDAGTQDDVESGASWRDQLFVMARRRNTGISPELWAQLSSRTFWAVLVWMSLSFFWANHYVGTVAEQLYFKADTDPVLTRAYTDIFNVVLPLGVLGIPLFGWITERMGFQTCIVATTLLGVAFGWAAICPGLGWQIAAFIFYALFRTFMVSFMFSFLSAVFGYSFFGVLTGLILAISGLLCLLHYPLREFQTDAAGFQQLQWAQLLILGLSGGLFSVWVVRSGVCEGLSP